RPPVELLVVVIAVSDHQVLVDQALKNRAHRVDLPAEPHAQCLSAERPTQRELAEHLRLLICPAPMGLRPCPGSARFLTPHSSAARGCRRDRIQEQMHLHTRVVSFPGSPRWDLPRPPFVAFSLQLERPYQTAA